ncbi:hypothetical protein IJD34_00180 [bacterium]|nr:hypothetical protein [bacterium]
MRHCCAFKALDIYYLKETNLYISRKLSFGFCPICSKPVAELYQVRFDGVSDFRSVSGIKADLMVNALKSEILYSMRECNYRKFKIKPYGWKYGVNKAVKIKGTERIRQYAYDFYGNKEIIKTV